MYEIEVENKNIIITDPCYLNDVMNEKDKTDELKNYWRKFNKGLEGDDYRSKLKKFGFTNNICCSTKYGDWSCTTYKVDFDPTRIKTFEDLKLFEEERTASVNIGGFCADAGMVCVVDAEEIKKFNPNFFEWAFFHKYCVTGVYNFTGKIGVIDIDPHSENFPHFRIRVIYGVADKEKNPNGYNFLAYQTGL